MTDGIYVGIDVGSSATKCVLLDGAQRIVAHELVPSGFDYAAAAHLALNAALCSAGHRQRDITYCVSTGYGREHVHQAARRITEITCHARGARQWNDHVRHIIDIGGQDTKVIWINPQGRMADYRMNAKCAAGTGTFLESIALKLGLPLKELDELAMSSTKAITVNSYCTVFAGTEVIERIKAGQSKEDICMGLFRSIATRVLEMMSSRSGSIGATGGVVAHCRAMVRALEEVFEDAIVLPPLPQFAGAFGAALLAAESSSTSGRRVSDAASR